MTPQQLRRLRRELNEYADYLTNDMGRPERRRAMEQYLLGLLLDGERKSIEPMAARLVDDPSRIEGMRQRLQQCVTVSPWSEDEMFRRVALKLDDELPDVETLIFDDTGFAKKGEHSVGVARQYSGTLGRTDNCQVAVSLHLAGERGSGCIAMRLYLPKSWAEDRARCAKAGVPDDVTFLPKWQIALEQLDKALDWGVRRHLVLADSGYGDATEFREGISERNLQYAVGISSTLVMWPPGTTFTVPRKTKAKGPSPSRQRGSKEPLSVKDLAATMSYRKITWREGTRGPQSSRFAAVRVRTAHGHKQGRPPGEEQWLLCEWPEEESAPSKYYLSSLPPSTSLKRLVRLVKLRWRIERDYQDMKGEVGLDHFEGRMWKGFHHHSALCAAAHAFLALRRALSPPEANSVDAAAGAKRVATDTREATRRVPAMSNAV